MYCSSFGENFFGKKSSPEPPFQKASFMKNIKILISEREECVSVYKLFGGAYDAAAPYGFINI